MHLTHNLMITTADPLQALTSATQLASHFEMSLQKLSVRRYRQADPVIDLHLGCDVTGHIDALVNHVRSLNSVSHVSIEHVLTDQSCS